MAANFEYQVKIVRDCLYAVFKGKAGIADIKRSYQSLFDMADRHKITRVFKDCRELELACSSFELLQLMKQLRQDFKRFKIARLVSMQGHREMLIQQIAAKKNLALENFYCTKTAELWLASGLAKF
ncbi:hypothetical protein SG34_007955 [Thalassomonas viridans]|uniref:Uncharacterized protein n=1 Tax=Thalassomonas viridans TaxID=137584 RepID=A0AAF0C8V0_9GAMM|nr:hypothetical protein [Thalassomonas viridans]WDE06822.1 hypothetical protein SG34_007955 [Thalassomonas viridans]